MGSILYLYQESAVVLLAITSAPLMAFEVFGLRGGHMLDRHSDLETSRSECQEGIAGLRDLRAMAFVV